MKIVLKNTNLEFVKEIPYESFSGSSNQYANTYWDRVILTNNIGYQFENPITIRNWVTTENIANWQLFDGERWLGVFTDTIVTATKMTGTLVTQDYGTFTIEIDGNLNDYQIDLVTVATQTEPYAADVTDLMDKINYSNE